MQDLTAIAEGCFLQKLNVRGCHQITNNGLTAIARGCPDLVFLDISHLQNIGDMVLAEIGEGITDAGLAHLVKGCLQLEICKMDDVLPSSDCHWRVATILSSCSKLKRLDVEQEKLSGRTRRSAGSLVIVPLA